MSNPEEKPVKQATAIEVAEKRSVTWNDIGESFEVMGKVGLALAIGMSAAGLFCRLADQGKVRVPTLSGLVLNRGANQSNVKEPPKA